MICISVMQESRKLALVDMLNAAPQCDLLELRLDKFEKSADIRAFLAKKPRPVIMTCRRPRDGGFWEGSETERLALLRQCIIDKADYVEIELDVADQIRPYPGAQRVISYTNMAETPEAIQEIYDDCLTKKPDIVKLVCKAATPDEAWPLIQIVARATVPTVVVGLGKPGIMLTLLGKRIGAPWTYAALEKGMETYPGQPTVRDLHNIYHFGAIGKGVRFVGVTGFSPREFAVCAVLNAGLAAAEAPARCLPLSVGSFALFRKVMDAIKLGGVVVDPEHQIPLYAFAQHHETLAEHTGAVDLLLHEPDKSWRGHYTLGRAALVALEELLKAKHPSDHPLQGRMTLILGVNGPAHALTWGVKKRGGVPIIVSRHREVAQRLAQQYQCRYVPFEAIYATGHDVLIICEQEEGPTTTRPGLKPTESGLHPSILKSTAPLLDLTTMPWISDLAKEAILRGVPVVDNRRLFLEQIELMVKLLTGKEADPGVLSRALAAAIDESQG
jgi:3-dehydroquinate dehydratase/shikimate dehydrogenase